MNSKSKLFVFFVCLYFFTVCFTAKGMDVTGDDKKDTVAAIDTTEIVLLGTLHGKHRENVAYSYDILCEIIVALKPSAILIEMPPQIGGMKTVKNGRVAKKFAGNENKAADQAAETLGVEVIPYDREGRNEFYKATDYFERQRQAHKRLDDWITEMAQKDRESLEVAIVGALYPTVNMSQTHLMSKAGPDIINSPACDMIIMNKKYIQHRLRPKMLDDSGEEELAEEFRFFRKEWEERNRIMADNIYKIANQYFGKRIVVLCGLEHRYILRDQLRKNTIYIKEFYEVSEGATYRIEHRQVGEPVN